MDSLKSFLYPKRKGNLKFVVSDAFVDEKGKPIEWEIRELTAQEGLEVQRALATDSAFEVVIAYAAQAIAYPDLCNKELLDGLSAREGRPVLTARDALVALTTDSELAHIYEMYLNHNRLRNSFDELVDDAKN